MAAETIIDQNSKLLTSEKLVANVLSANPQLEVAQAAWKASVARIEQQTAFEAPLLATAWLH